MNPHAVLVSLVESTMRRVAPLEATAARLEVIAAAEALAVYAGEELGGRVAVEVGEAEGVCCYVPAGSKPEEVAEWC